MPLRSQPARLHAAPPRSAPHRCPSTRDACSHPGDWIDDEAYAEHRSEIDIWGGEPYARRGL
jgi:hypothetical protein